jgi:hypothetical protein
MSFFAFDSTANKSVSTLLNRYITVSSYSKDKGSTLVQAIASGVLREQTEGIFYALSPLITLVSCVTINPIKKEALVPMNGPYQLDNWYKTEGRPH